MTKSTIPSTATPLQRIEFAFTRGDIDDHDAIGELLELAKIQEQRLDDYATQSIENKNEIVRLEQRVAQLEQDHNRKPK